MAKKPKVSRFSGRVKDNAQKTKSTGASYGYMNLPKGISVFSPEPGSKCMLDFMPYVVTSDRHPDGISQGEWWYKRPFKIHRNIGVEKQSVVCLTSIGKKCPICEHRAEMIKDGQDKKDTDALKASNRNLYVVIPKNNKKFDEKPHIMDISAAMFQNLLAEELEENDQYEVFPDLEQGYTLKIRFDSKTIGSSKPFAEASRIDFEDRDSQYSEDMIKEIPDLDSVLNIMNYQMLEKKFFEMDDADEDDSPPPAPAKTRSKKPEPEPEEENEPEPEEDADDICTACQGSGKNSKGGTCRICRGSGEMKKEEPPKTDPKKSKCPFGHTFGDDCEKYDHCDDCDKWDECIEEKEKK